MEDGKIGRIDAGTYEKAGCQDNSFSFFPNQSQTYVSGGGS